MPPVRNLAPVALAVGLAFAGPAAAAGLDGELCIADWSEAAPIVCVRT